MKLVDKFGRKIYSKTFRILLFYGKLLEEAGYRESKKKPNLFYRKTEDVIFFADMRGTDEVPIWEDPTPLFYWKFVNEGEKYPDWKKRRILVKKMNRLKEDFDVPTRLSFFEECEPDGLFFGYGGIVGDGYCVVCGKDFQDEGLFCSKECELEYRRNELRGWLEAY